jgi:hypothetical protein
MDGLAGMRKVGAAFQELIVAKYKFCLYYKIIKILSVF